MGDVFGLQHPLNLAVPDKLGFKFRAFFTFQRRKSNGVAAATVFSQIIGCLSGVVDSTAFDEAFDEGEVFLCFSFCVIVGIIAHQRAVIGDKDQTAVTLLGR